MREGAAHEGEITHARQADIGDELTLAAQVPIVFEPGNGDADAFALCLPHPDTFPLARCAQPSAY